MIFELLKEIEKEVNRDEYISYGASYFLSVDDLKFKITDITSLIQLFEKLEDQYRILYVTRFLMIQQIL